VPRRLVGVKLRKSGFVVYKADWQIMEELASFRFVHATAF
jgi:hypothetical protein